MLPGGVAVMFVMMLARTFMGMLMIIFNEVAGIAMFMGMNMKYPDEQEHGQQAAKRPTSRTINRTLLGQRVRQEVQECHPEHEAADEAHQELHVSMGQLY